MSIVLYVSSLTWYGDSLHVEEGGRREGGRERERKRGREERGYRCMGSRQGVVTMGMMACKHFVCVIPNMRTQVTHTYVQLHKCTLAFCVLASP